MPQALRTMLTVAGILLIATSAIFGDSCFAASNAKDGIWSRHGEILSAPFQKKWSPSHRLYLEENNEGVRVVGKTTTTLPDILATPPLVEVVWSPKSDAFAVNGSEGGLVGEWKTHLYSLDAEDRPIPLDIAALIAPFVRNFPKCPAENPYANLGATEWLNEGQELLIVAEVPDHSLCSNMGEIKGFRVSVSEWKILEEIPPQKLRRIWHSYLGPRIGSLKSARHNQDRH